MPIDSRHLAVDVGAAGAVVRAVGIARGVGRALLIFAVTGDWVLQSARNAGTCCKPAAAGWRKLRRAIARHPLRAGRRPLLSP